MKLCKLKLKNLNSFREPIDIDFEAAPLNDASLVAITGPTGAGKTTLLDAICVALYGNTPRLSGTGSQNPNHLISHGEKEAFAEVHFMVNGTRYIAIWSIKRGGSARVKLSYAADDKLISDKLSTRGKSLGSSQRTVSEEVESILGLDFDAFKRSVMLAQGEFAAFLKAKSEERRTILEATAGIGIYDELKKALKDKVDEVEAEHQEVFQKLGAIPEVSCEQLTQAETELNRLQMDADVLDAKSKEVQTRKERETKRKEDFEKLEFSEKCQKELLNQQPAIDVFKEEQKLAEKAQRLLPEKQTFDTAKPNLEEAEKALRVAATEKMGAEKQIETDQAIFDKKERIYSEASDNSVQLTKVYNEAKLDVKRAVDQFAEADKRTPELANLDSQIKTLSDQLTDRETEQTQLQKRIDEAKIFLDENHLPSNRQYRLTEAKVLLSQLDSQQKQLETASASKAQHENKVSSLKREIGKLSKTHKERLSEKADAGTTLKSAIDELDNLQSVGTQEEWTARKRQASKAQPIAQKYEAAENDLAGSEDHLHELKETRAEVDAELEQIGDELTSQAEVYQSAAEAVERCEEALKSAMLANPINQLRQHLHAGEPCLVCGATEHPFADAVEPESEELLQNAKNALAEAKANADDAQDDLQTLKTNQTQTQQNKRNIASQISACTGEIETLQDESSQCLVQWQEIYPDADVSSEWVAKQVEKADTAIADLGNAHQAYTQASHTYQMVSQQFKTCEDDIKRETKSLNESKDELQTASDDVEDLRADIAVTKDSFWELLPDAFHGFAPDTAVDQFDDKIKEVAKRKDELDRAEAALNLLNVSIGTDQRDLENLQKNRDELQAEIDEYRRDAEVSLAAVSEKTDGLKTEDEINTAINKLEVELQTKESERDGAEQQLQESRNLFLQKQTTHEFREKQHKDCDEKFEAARQTYFDKLSEAGFDSPEAHDSAFRDGTRMQELTDRIDTHIDEIQRLELDIRELSARFDENPFKPDMLGNIQAQAETIEGQLQAKQKEIGAQGERIKGLEDALQKREALGTEMSEAEQELGRWKRLQETIPTNSLRDFALEIMFKQMGSLANEQLRYLTSDRYQLKVETIGDLSVIDRWNANEERPVETLSGGESFLTSLALALALADLSRGRAQLNSLFLDEGFGTLDTETLDTAIAALEGIRMQGRSIFVISHVQELMRRLPVKINVKKEGNGSSSVQVQG